MTKLIIRLYNLYKVPLLKKKRLYLASAIFVDIIYNERINEFNV